MVKLNDFAYNVHSQFGEDGIIEHVFEKINTTTKFCVEFGASYDLVCSNVAALWYDQDWDCLLFEMDPACCTGLISKLTSNCEILWKRITPSGRNSIDNLTANRPDIDFMSIDIDGNDYHVWKEMEVKPRLLCVEFNPTVPPHISLYQQYDPTPMGFGASLRAFIDLGETKGYTFIGATQINAFFVLDELAEAFSDYEKDPTVLFPLTGYTYLVTDFQGAALATGVSPPWSIHVPYIGPGVIGDSFSLTEDSGRTMDAYAAKYGYVVRWVQEDHPNLASPDVETAVPGGLLGSVSARELLKKYFSAGASPICLAIEHISSPEHVAWVYPLAELYGYQVRRGGGTLTLVHHPVKGRA